MNDYISVLQAIFLPSEPIFANYVYEESNEGMATQVVRGIVAHNQIFPMSNHIYDFGKAKLEPNPNH